MYLQLGAKGVQSLAKIGGQGISSVVALLGEGGVCLGDASSVGMIDGLFVWGSGVGFGPCHAFVLCPGDVAIYEGVFIELAEAGSLSFQSFALHLVFEGAGNRCGVLRRGKCVGGFIWWVCCKLG